MKILTVTSGKGGVGKSTITLNIARQLSLSGKRTLLVDFDIHNKGITGLFLPSIQTQSATVTTIVHQSSGFTQGNTQGDIKDMKLIRVTADANLLLLPASHPQEMIQWDRFHSENALIVGFFRAFFENLAREHRFDVIVIDCYGGIDSLTVAAAGIADDTIIVNEPDLITFSGTLQLYIYIRKQYVGAPRKPLIHFVINRITSRHSFTFLEREYNFHLASLSIDDAILAYFPYDKLLLETFGDYPFFTELLPHGLFTRKIRLLIETLWKNEPSFSNFSRLSRRQRDAVFRRTVESPFADPERIIRTVVTAPFWLIVPSAMLLALDKGWGGSLHYRTIQVAYYTAVCLLLFLAGTIGFFEPVQISRWLWREAAYHRRKRYLKRQVGRLYRILVFLGEAFRACLPAIAGLIFLGAGGYYAQRMLRSRQALEIWPAEVYGFSPHGSYAGMRLRFGAGIRPGTTFAHADLRMAQLAGVKLTHIDFDGADLQHSNLSDAAIADSNFTNANLVGANLLQARIKNSDFTNADLSSDLTKGSSNATPARAAPQAARPQLSNLSRADIEGSTFMNARLVGATLLPVSIKNSHFEGADFENSFLNGAELEDSYLAGADFKSSFLFGTKFERCDLTGADFSAASLYRTTFDDKSTLTEAKFSAEAPSQIGTLAGTLVQRGAQVQTTAAKGTTPLASVACGSADCEFQAAWSQLDFLLPNLIESLTLKGGAQNWNDARRLLDQLRSSPMYGTDKQVEGRYLVLALLLRLARGEPHQDAANAWCGWLLHNKLTSWRWTIWDASLPRNRFSKLVLQKMDAVEASAKGALTPPDLCSRLRGNSPK